MNLTQNVRYWLMNQSSLLANSEFFLTHCWSVPAAPSGKFGHAILLKEGPPACFMSAPSGSRYLWECLLCIATPSPSTLTRQFKHTGTVLSSAFCQSNISNSFLSPPTHVLVPDLENLWPIMHWIERRGRGSRKQTTMSLNSILV